MSRDSRTARSQNFPPKLKSMATEADEYVTSWEDFFSGLINLLDFCDCHSLNVNLDFPYFSSNFV